MSRYVVTPQARADIKEICRYIAKDSRLAAGKTRELFYGKFVLLAEHPLIGQARPDLAAEVRSFSAGHYVIFFRPMGNGVEIVRVLHGARDIEAIFGEPR